MPQYTVTMPAVMSARLYGSTWDARGPQNRWTITAGRYGDAGTSHRGFLRFGDWTIPGYANIVSATLRIYQYSASNSSGYTFTISGVKDNGDTSGDGSIWTGANRNGATWDTTATNTVYLSSSGKYPGNCAGLARGIYGSNERDLHVLRDDGILQNPAQSWGRNLLPLYYDRVRRAVQHPYAGQGGVQIGGDS